MVCPPNELYWVPCGLFTARRSRVFDQASGEVTGRFLAVLVAHVTLIEAVVHDRSDNAVGVGCRIQVHGDRLVAVAVERGWVDQRQQPKADVDH
jgi:hypothetical protein